jgi:predicted kinase
MTRIQLAENRTAKIFPATTIVLANNFKELVVSAAKKFKFNPKNVRLFLATKKINADIGTEITSEEDYKKIIVDDILIVVSNKCDFKGIVSKKKTVNINELNSKLSYPPRYPFPTKSSLINDQLEMEQGVNEVKEDEIEAEVVKDNKIDTVIKVKAETEIEMNGIFPIFKGNVLNIIRNAIKNEEKIKEYLYDGYICFNYVDGMNFNFSNDNIDNALANALKRECRGLIVSSITGCVLARRFHKFFNLNENDQSLIGNIDFTNMTVTEKLDGSLVSPVLLDSNNIIWLTRKNRIIEVEQFIESSNINYNEFAKNQLLNKITPLFEWCDNTRYPGVIHYEKKQLTLIGLRHNETGSYLNIKDVNAVIPVTQEYNVQNINELVNTVQTIVGKEGVVITLPSHEKYKLKSMWHVNMLQARKYGGTDYFLPEMIKLTKTLKNIPSDKIWYTVLQNSDDVLSLCMTILNVSDTYHLRLFITSVQESIKNLESDLISWTKNSATLVPDLETIGALAESVGWPTWLIPDIISQNPITDKLKKLLINYAKNHNINILEELLDIKWDSERGQDISTDTILDIITFHKPNDFNVPSNMLQEHVITKYFPKKLSTLLGIKQINNDTIINISDKYVANEGKIIGMWEKFTEYNIWDLRVDLQPPKKGEYTDHNGNYEYALFLVQYGLLNNIGPKPFGSFAGILVPTNCDLSYEYLSKALENSFLTQKIIKIKRKQQSNLQFKIFCDLDGVLADFDKGIKNISGFLPEMQSLAKMWQRINNYPKFFESLDFTPYGKQLWQELCDISKTTPTILTGVPPKFSKQHSQEKKKWCETHLGNNVNVITCLTADKYKYSTKGHILIDDNLESGKLWTAYTGIFIHHITYDRTLYELKHIYKQINKFHFDDFETDKLDNYVCTKSYTILTDNWIESPGINNIVAIDCEWSPGSPNLALFQIATRDHIYIIDMLNTTDLVLEQLANMLSDSNIIKLTFGTDNTELAKINSNIISLIDLQEVVMTHYDISKDKVPSLNKICASILNKNLNKTKELQASDWSIRPLSSEQLQYAFNDVTSLFDLYDCITTKLGYLIPPKNMYYNRDTKIRTDICEDLETPVRILMCCIFLSDTSIKELLTKFKPKFKHVEGKYMILKHEPTEYEMRGIPIGNNVSIKLLKELVENEVQIIICEYSGKLYQIVISANNSDYKLNSIKLSNDNNDNNNFGNIFGNIGVIVENITDPLVGLSQKIKEKITDFTENCSDGSLLKFKPTELSAMERSIIHEYAKNAGLLTESTGTKDNRKLVIKVKRKNNITEVNSDAITRKIIDPYYFSVLKIVSKNKTIAYDGYIGQNTLSPANKFNFLNDKLSKNMIILRGLPGSGKSSVATYFMNVDKKLTVVCTADNYFMTDDKYVFNKNLLADAHVYCYNSVKHAIENNVNTIIIDNTNCKLIEYKKYIDIGKINNYKITVIEIFCENKDKALEFAKRSSHDVPNKDILKMLSLWETDDNALLLESYMCQNNDNDIYNDSDYENEDKVVNVYNNYESFNKWLQDNNMIHYNKLRRKTHISFVANANQSFCFLDVPDQLYDEFLEHYSYSHEPKYLTELIPDSNEKQFKMFFDIDNLNLNLLDQDILDIIHILQNHVNSDIYVTMCSDNGKFGMHLKCPEQIVTVDEALAIRNNCIIQLYETYPDKNWDAIMDASVYMVGRGLRMYGSRKAVNNNDIGRVYKFLFTVSKTGEQYVTQLSDHELLKMLSIHIQ